MKMSDKTIIAVFCYKRAAKLKVSIEALLKNPECPEMDIVFFSDGARNEADKAGVNATREYINSLIDDQVIEHYAVSMEVQTVWITINASNKTEVRKILSKSPFKKYWKFDIHELIIWDGQNYRLPVVQLN